MINFLKKLFLIIFSAILLFAAEVQAQISFRGYLENRLFLTFLNNNFSPNKLDKNMRSGNFNRARVIMEKEVSERSSITVAVDYFTYHGMLMQTYDSGSNDSNNEKISIDRAYIRLYFDRADVTIGKQLISWGRSFVWSPFDVYNRINVFEPREEKSGVNAFRITVPVGDLSNFEAVYEVNDKLDDSRFGLRSLWNVHNVEFALNAIHNPGQFFKQDIAGFEIKLDYGPGIWIEGARFNEESYGSVSFNDTDYYKWIFGFDYSHDFGKLLYFMTEYMIDTGGADNKDSYDFLRPAFGRSQFMAKNYLYSMLQLQYTDLLNASVSTIANLTDNGVMIMPSFGYLLFPDTQLTIGAYIPVAEKGTEFRPSTTIDLQGTSGSSTVFLWLKLFF